MSKVIWTLAVAYGLVGLGLFYSLAVDSSELFLAMTTVIYVLNKATSQYSVNANDSTTTNAQSKISESTFSTEQPKLNTASPLTGSAGCSSANQKTNAKRRSARIPLIQRRRL